MPAALLSTTLGLDPRQARTALAYVTRVLSADVPTPPSAAVQLALATHWLDVEDPPPSVQGTPPETAAHEPPSYRRALVEALAVVAAIDGEVTLAREQAVRSIAEQLAVRSPWLGVLSAMRARSVLRVKRALAQRSPDAKRILRRTWDEEGLAGLGRAALFIAGLHRDHPLSTRFRALGQLELGTLGRQFHDDLVSRQLAFPGEAGGLPERMVHHDLMHVLTGYGTDPAGECELAGFYAGLTSAAGDPDAITFLFTALATFHLAMPVSPAIVTPARGAFDPERVLDGFVRGRRVRVDVMGPWDYWPLMSMPLERAAASIGIQRSPAG